MPYLAWIITLISTVENFFPYLVGLSLTPKGSVFLGTVHHPGDYFYYVSQFAQGANRWLTTLDLYTAESISPTLIGWSNVLLGHIFSLTGISSFGAYQATVVLFTILIFLVAYQLAKEVLGNPRLATIALYLFAIYHAFPIVREGKPSYGDYFNNFAVPRVRFGAVPHQLLLGIASICLSYFIIKSQKIHKNYTIKLLIGVAISSVILASLQPALWAIIIGAHGITAIIYMLSQKDKKNILNTYIFPIFIAGFAGLVPIFYLSNLFKTLPFAQLKIWEASQQTSFTLGHFLSATGPIFLIALVAMLWLIKNITYAKAFIALFTIISFVVFLSPIPALLTLSHVRFMSTLVILCVAIMATIAVEQFSKTILHSLRKLSSFARAIQPQHVSLTILTLLTIYLLPNHLLTVKLASEFSTTNAYHYITKNDYEFMQRVVLSAEPDDIYLVIWPYNTLFPAITGKRSFHGHSLLTINTMQKDALAVQFFENKMNDTTAQMFLRNNHISHVLTYSWSTLPKVGMTQTATNGTLSLFAVNPENLKPYSK